MALSYPFPNPNEATYKDSPPAYEFNDSVMEMSDSAPLLFQMRDFRREQAFIAVMGMTGSGKSTFIRNFCKTAIIGEETAKVEAHPAETTIYGHEVVFVDTPGFDDTTRYEADILREIADWISGADEKGIKLTGIVYLHGIQNPRVGGTMRSNLRLFRKLCGDASMSSVALATTHWSSSEADRVAQRRRHQELIDDGDFWAKMMANGAQDFIHDKGLASALEIVRYLLDQRPPGGLKLAIQQEMASGMTLNETGAGKALEEKLDSIRESYERTLQSLRVDLDEAKRENKRTHEQREIEVKSITEEIKKLEKRIEDESLDRMRLQVDLATLQKQRQKELERVAEDAKRSYDELADRLALEHEEHLRVEVEKEKVKRKQLQARIRHAQECTVM
ncbi:hypothetical protein PV08_01275 [Exophiala spinifera]|uniref:G domain-containing protein n=1 Tax=Exophiala spinifera TaxID=91928 RepID=A0A0D2BP48_9EURO|nr:uncharacterized protein PV08_01275 [Exophiala spinifera]KIW20698.1 hypothetical protein PV08_01275 [Exophiala spinifera]